MDLSREAELVSGISLLSVPAIVYGGLTLLGVVTGGSAGLAPGGVELNETQRALWRAGHAHAGVWLIFSLVLQVMLDSAALGSASRWTARIAVPVAAVAVSGGFFGLAYVSAFRWLVYVGALLLLASVILTAVGLLRRPEARPATG